MAKGVLLLVAYQVLSQRLKIGKKTSSTYLNRNHSVAKGQTHTTTHTQLFFITQSCDHWAEVAWSLPRYWALFHHPAILIWNGKAREEGTMWFLTRMTDQGDLSALSQRALPMNARMISAQLTPKFCGICCSRWIPTNLWSLMGSIQESSKTD